MRLSDIKEIALINQMSRSLPPPDESVVVSIGDDAAVVSDKRGWYRLYTCDMLVEGVHFRKKEQARLVGYKAVAVSVSDIAAMGGIPEHALISVGLPSSGLPAVARGLFEGIRSCARQFGVGIIGGDTNRSPVLVIDVFMTGRVRRADLCLRSGAKDGDFIFVSGALGNSFASGRHLTFTPRMKQARFLLQRWKVHAMMDLSDGLAMDLHRMAHASGLGAYLFESKIPLNPDARSVDHALYDGEDFELLFTLPRGDAEEVIRGTQANRSGKGFHLVGQMTSRWTGVKMVGRNGRVRDIAPQGFSHF